MHSFGYDIFLFYVPKRKPYGNCLSVLYIEIEELGGRIVNDVVMNLLCTRRYVPLSCYVAAPRNPIFKFTLHFFCWLEAFGFAGDAIRQVYRSLGSLKEGENMLSWLPQRDLKTLCHSLSWRQDLLQPSTCIYLFIDCSFWCCLESKAAYCDRARFSVVLGCRRKKKTVSVPFSSPCAPCHYAVTCYFLFFPNIFSLQSLAALEPFLALRTGSSLLWKQQRTRGSTEVDFKLSSAEKANFILVYIHACLI